MTPGWPGGGVGGGHIQSLLCETPQIRAAESGGYTYHGWRHSSPASESQMKPNLLSVRLQIRTWNAEQEGVWGGLESEQPRRWEGLRGEGAQREARAS